MQIIVGLTALVGSLSIGMTFLVSPLAGIMIDSFGLRRTAMLGGAVATIGMLASSFAMAHVILENHHFFLDHLILNSDLRR